MTNTVENELKQLRDKVNQLEKERDSWRKQALEENAVAEIRNINASRFSSYKEMVEYWSNNFRNIKKPLMVWAFEKE